MHIYRLNFHFWGAVWLFSELVLMHNVLLEDGTGQLEIVLFIHELTQVGLISFNLKTITIRALLIASNYYYFVRKLLHSKKFLFCLVAIVRVRFMKGLTQRLVSKGRSYSQGPLIWRRNSSALSWLHHNFSALIVATCKPNANDRFSVHNVVFLGNTKIWRTKPT